MQSLAWIIGLVVVLLVAFSIGRLFMQQARGAEDRSGHASPIVKDTRRLGGALVENSEKLSTELDQLRKKQLDALADETFVGLTDQELFQYDQRLERIHELYAKLRKLKDAA